MILMKPLIEIIYLSGDRNLTDIPLDLAQDVTRNIIQNRRQKDRIVKFSDGDRVYIALNQKSAL